MGFRGFEISWQLRFPAFNRCIIHLDKQPSIFDPLPASVAVNAAPISEFPMENPQVTKLVNRLDEIKEMDKSAKSHTEKKGLRQEVRSIKKELRVVSGGIYISVGAAILIALLLILLLAFIPNSISPKN